MSEWESQFFIEIFIIMIEGKRRFIKRLQDVFLSEIGLTRSLCKRRKLVLVQFPGYYFSLEIFACSWTIALLPTLIFLKHSIAPFLFSTLQWDGSKNWMVPKLGSHACSHLELPDELGYKDDCTIYDPTKRASNSLSVFSFENPRSSVFPNRSPIISHPHVFEEQEIIAYSLFSVCKMLNYSEWDERSDFYDTNVSITWAVQNKVAKRVEIAK